MDDKTIEQIIIKAVEIGVYNTLSQLGLTSEVITEAQARKKIWATINCRMALEKVDRWISNRKPQKKQKYISREQNSRQPAGCSIFRISFLQIKYSENEYFDYICKNINH